MGGCNDWVLTTAFYSSLHLIEHELFPMKEKGKVKFANFNQYYYSLPRGMRGSKHEVKLNLAHSLTIVGGPYQHLYDVCMDARYKEYRVSDAEAQFARSKLNEIEAAMTK